MKDLLNKVANELAALAAAQDTLAALPQVEGLPGFNLFVSNDDTVKIYTYSTSEAALDACGRAFGKDGWTAKPDGRSYDWHKTVGNIAIELRGVKEVPPLVEYKVQASEFPVLLEA
jgi:hypothetical protein